MVGEYQITCDNAFISIALQNILQQIKADMPWRNLHLLRVQVVMAKNPVDELATFSDIDIDDYDIILCSAFYHSIIINFLPALRNKFLCLDSDCESLKRNIKNTLLSHDRKESMAECHFPALTFTPGEMAFISDYLACLCAKQIARKDDCGVKSVSNRKRLIMAKVNSQSTLQFWITLKFLMIFDHPSLSMINTQGTARSTRRRLFETLHCTPEHRFA
ncbi:hypothetical protein GWD52_01430 [Enterobacteriaceae bacterium 4M9]|nr:hypothetical protein [Enterobacteriaceae bacterium 4M9]